MSGETFPRSKPYLNMRHPVAPVLCCSDGRRHWLDWWQRLTVWFGWHTAESMERKVRPDLYLWAEKANAAIWPWQRRRKRG